MDRSVYSSTGKIGDTTGIARRVAQISVSAVKKMPVLPSKMCHIRDIQRRHSGRDPESS
ncbi:MAG: hypothetical protein LJE96_18710 [Deltaproteobacteria bacterium]|nr:hypothetical protein [Deltaproteobacteria bacterium]